MSQTQGIFKASQHVIRTRKMALRNEYVAYFSTKTGHRKAILLDADFYSTLVPLAILRSDAPQTRPQTSPGSFLLF